MNPWLVNLNPEQQEAVLHNQGPLLILAGAGSGKTTVLVSRTGRLIDERLTTPERICVLTFTNKAAHELKDRVARKVGVGAKKVWAGTFHGFGLQLLKENYKEAELPKKFGVIDGSDALAVLKEILRNIKAYEKERFAAERVMERVLLLRQGGSEKSLDDSVESAMAISVKPKFQKRLKELGVVDFEDLLLRPLKIIKEHSRIRERFQSRFDYVMVDEFQDTNATQMLLIDQLVATHKNIAVVGDDDQSIYGWRGAEVRHILDFPKHYKNAKVIRLERNYRSSEPILNMANAIIAANRDRHGKILRPGKVNPLAENTKPELFVFESEEVEVDQVVNELMSFARKGYRYRDMAILYRSNSQGGLMEGGLRRAQIPYKLTGGTALFDRKEVKDVLAFIRSSLFPTEVSFRRIINLPSRGVGEKTLEAIENMEASLEFYQKARAWAKSNSEESAAQGILRLFEFLEHLKTQLVESPLDPEEVLDKELRQFSYRDHVNQSYRDASVADKRWLGVMILGRILSGMFTRHGRTLDTLERFIDAMELRDPVDEAGDEKANEVQMMTLHACKGLEFPLVFLLGVEEDLLPHAKLGLNIDEERRLFYVGVTRAQKHLILTRARARKRYGRPQPVSPSRFLVELDPALYTEHETGRPLEPGERETMVADFLKKLTNKIAAKEKAEADQDL